MNVNTVSKFCQRMGIVFAALAAVLVCPKTHAGTLHAAIVQFTDKEYVGSSHTYFATLINDTDAIARNCRIEIDEKYGFRLSYWTTDQTHNFPTGDKNTPADLWPRSRQSYMLTLDVRRKPERTSGSIYPEFVCDTNEPAVRVAGINDIQLESFDFSRLVHYTDADMEAFEIIAEKIESSGQGIDYELTDAERELILKLQAKRRR